MKRSIATRMAAMFAVAAFVVFSVVGVALHRILAWELERHQRREITTRLEFMAHMIGRQPTVERWANVRMKLDAMTPMDGSTQFWVIGPDPRFEYGEPSPELRRRLLERGDGVIAVGAVGAGQEERPMTILTQVVPAGGERPEVRLTAGINAGRFLDTQRFFATALALVCAAGTVLVALLGFRLARLGLSPLARLSAEAQAISPENRAQRLRPQLHSNELSDLTASFNGALDRLEHAYAQLEGFNADVAHELRTPLTNLIGQTQVALGKDRPAAALKEVLQSNLEELERLRAIVNDMLFLARADRGAMAKNRERASVAREIGATVEFLDVILDEAGVSVKVSGDAQVPIETSLFRRAVTNLLQNAVEHSGRGAEIRVDVEPLSTGARIAVKNAGEPIADHHAVRLFDRFYRVDGARESRGGNHGLGLSIVKAVASMHGGTVFASSGGGVNTVGFTVTGGGGGAESPRLPGRLLLEPLMERDGRRGLLAQPHVEQLHAERERHRAVDVALADVLPHAFGRQHHPDEQEEAQGEDLHAGVPVDEVADRPGEDEHHAHGDHHRDHHDGDVPGHPHGGDDRVQGEDHVQGEDLREDEAEGRPRGG